MTQITLTNRHETLFLWDVRKSNPNGDPSGNEPRIDRHTKKCDVTDVCIKRSVRDYISKIKGIDSILITRLGEDTSQIVTLTERLTDFLFGSDEKKEKTFNLVENLIKDVLGKIKTRLQDVEHKKSEAKNDKEKEELEREGKNLKKKLKIFEEFKVNKSAEKLKALIDERENRPHLIKDLRKHLCQCFYDLRMFGSVLAIKSKTPLADIGGPLTGPIQIEVGTSLHKVVQSNKQITSIMAPDKKFAGGEEEVEHGGGLFGDTHCIEYGLFATSAIANENAARFTGITNDDHELFLKALWRGTRDRHTRSKNQVPRLLIDIEYNRPFHFGDFVNSVGLKPVKKDGKLFEEEFYRSIDDFTLDLTRFYEKTESKNKAIESIEFASNGLIAFEQFKQGLHDDLKEKSTELTDIDFD
jgi:CRISPR-associated protein Cas7/Csh2 subtype I-B